MARKRVMVGDLSPSTGVAPVARPVETFAPPPKPQAETTDLTNFMQAIAPAVEAESKAILKEKAKRDAQIASNKLQNQEHQINMALIDIGSKVTDDFSNNKEAYFQKGTKQAVTEVTKFYNDYRAKLEDSGVSSLLLDMYDRKKDLAIASWAIKDYAPVRKVWNLGQQDEKFNATMLNILNHPDHYESPEDQIEAFRDMYESHVMATGNDYERVNSVFMNLLQRHVSTTGQKDALYDFAQVAGRDNSSLFNIDKYSKIVSGIENKIASTEVARIKASKDTAEASMLSDMLYNFASEPSGTRDTSLLRIGQAVTIDLGQGITHTFTPTFEDYVPYIEQQHQETLAIIGTNPNEDQRKTMLDTARRDRLNTYIAYGKIPTDIQNNVRNGLTFFNMHNSDNPQEVQAAKTAFDALEEVYAYSNGESIAHVLKSEGNRNRYHALRQLVRTGVHFNEALSLVNGEISDFDTVKVSYDDIKSGLDKGFFHFTNVDEGTIVRSNAVLSNEVGKLATTFLNVQVVANKEDAIAMALKEIGKQYTAVSGTGDQVSLVRLQVGDAEKTATTETMEQHLKDLRADTELSELIASRFISEVEPNKRLGVSGIGLTILEATGMLNPSFDLAYEPTGNPNVLEVYAYKDDGDKSIIDRVQVGTFDLTKSAFEAAEEFRQQKMKELNAEKQEEAQVQDISSLGVSNLFGGISTANASAFTDPALDLAMSNAVADGYDITEEQAVTEAIEEGNNTYETVAAGVKEVISKREKLETEEPSDFAKFSLIPSNMAQFAGSFLGDTMVKRSDLSGADLSLLTKIVREKLQKGEKTIQYEDYGFNTGGDTLKKGFMEAVSLSTTDPSYRMATLLGASSIKVEDGKVFIVDTYDFNKGKKGLELEKAIEANDFDAIMKVFEGQSFVQGLRTAAYVLQPEAVDEGVKIYLGKVEDFK